MTNRIKLGCLADYEQFTAGSTPLLLPLHFNHREPIDRSITHTHTHLEYAEHLTACLHHNDNYYILMLDNKTFERIMMNISTLNIKLVTNHTVHYVGTRLA